MRFFLTRILPIIACLAIVLAFVVPLFVSASGVVIDKDTYSYKWVISYDTGNGTIGFRNSQRWFGNEHANSFYARSFSGSSSLRLDQWRNFYVEVEQPSLDGSGTTFISLNPGYKYDGIFTDKTFDLSGLPVGQTVTVQFFLTGAYFNSILYENQAVSFFTRRNSYEAPSTRYSSYTAQYTIYDLVDVGYTDISQDVTWTPYISGQGRVYSYSFVSSGIDSIAFSIGLLDMPDYVDSELNPYFVCDRIEVVFDSDPDESSDDSSDDSSGGGGGGDSSSLYDPDSSLAGDISNKTDEQDQKKDQMEEYLSAMEVSDIGLSVPELSIPEPSGGSDLIAFIANAPGFSILLTTSCALWAVGIILYGKRS